MSRLASRRSVQVALGGLLLLPLLACGGGDGLPPPPAGPAPLQMLRPAALPYDALLPELIEPVEAIVEAFAAETGRAVHVHVPPEPYEVRLPALLAADLPPDVVWVAAPHVASLAEGGALVALDAFVAQRPEVRDGVPPDAADLFVHDGRRYGIPVGEKGVHCTYAYAVTAAAEQRGLAAAAFDLIAHLRRDAPRRNMPDIALDEVFATVEAGGGDVIELTVTLDLEVRNLGTVPAADVEVTFETEELGVFDQALIPLIDGESSEHLQIELPEMQAELYYVLAKADPGQNTGELSEANNWASHQIDLRPYLSGSTPGAPYAVKSTSAPFVIDAASHMTGVVGMHPKVAFDGTNYLVVWAKQTPLNPGTYNHQLRAARITPTGTILDPGGFLITSKKSKYNNFQVVFGGSQYLVAWEEDLYNDFPPVTDPMSIVAAARVSTSGTLTDTTPITVDAAPVSGYRRMRHEWPVVCYDGTNFVVVYRDLVDYGGLSELATDNGVFARRISSSGTLLTGKPKLLTIDDKYIAHHLQSMAFAGTEGLLVFQAYEPVLKRHGVRGLWFTLPGGVPTATAASPTGLAYWPMSPSAYDFPCAGVAGSGQYLAVWERDNTLTKCDDPELRYRRVPSSGGTLPAEAYVKTSTSDVCPESAYDGKNHVLVYAHRHGCRSYVGCVRVPPTSGIGATTFFKTTSDLVDNVDVAFGTTNGLVVFTNQIPPAVPGGNLSFSVRGQFIEKSP